MFMPALEAAMTSVPRLLMAPWITMLAMENTALWMPAGRPICTMVRMLFRSTCRRCGSMRTGESRCSRRTDKSTAMVV